MNEHREKCETSAVIRRTNAAIFIPHLGCPHTCSFCDQNKTTRAQNSVGAKEVCDILDSYAVSLKQRGLTAQIGFFGGTFTALSPQYREELLSTANLYLEKHPELFKGIRCSTRPDYIDESVLKQLRAFGVNAVELGVQSMDEEVLNLNNRNHSAEQVRQSAKLIKDFGFELGVQMMTGLLGDTPLKSLNTADELIKLKPDTARIYPTVIIKGTLLGDLYERGEFKTFSLEETIELCAEIYRRFTENNIKVIRLGLNISSKSDMKNEVIGGNYGLQLGELCIGRYYYNRMLEIMQKALPCKCFLIYADKRNFSKINGHRSVNKIELQKQGFTYSLVEKQDIDMDIHCC